MRGGKSISSTINCAKIFTLSLENRSAFLLRHFVDRNVTERLVVF